MGKTHHLRKHPKGLWSLISSRSISQWIGDVTCTCWDLRCGVNCSCTQANFCDVTWHLPSFKTKGGEHLHHETESLCWFQLGPQKWPRPQNVPNGIACPSGWRSSPVCTRPWTLKKHRHFNEKPPFFKGPQQQWISSWWFLTQLKNICQNGSFPQVLGWKVKIQDNLKPPPK